MCVNWVYPLIVLNYTINNNWEIIRVIFLDINLLLSFDQLSFFTMQSKRADEDDFLSPPGFTRIMLPWPWDVRGHPDQVHSSQGGWGYDAAQWCGRHLQLGRSSLSAIRVVITVAEVDRHLLIQELRARDEAENGNHAPNLAQCWCNVWDIGSYHAPYKLLYTTGIIVSFSQLNTRYILF